MADTQPTPVRIKYAIYLCLLAIFAPRKLEIEDDKDRHIRKNFPGKSEKQCRTDIIYRAFWLSLMLVAGSILCGFFLGILCRLFAVLSPKATLWMQISGAACLLWGTLFVRGWEIQTFCGVTITERVNRWLYIFLYCTGTIIIVWALRWAW